MLSWVFPSIWGSNWREGLLLLNFKWSNMTDSTASNRWLPLQSSSFLSFGCREKAKVALNVTASLTRREAESDFHRSGALSCRKTGDADVCIFLTDSRVLVRHTWSSENTGRKAFKVFFLFFSFWWIYNNKQASLAVTWTKGTGSGWGSALALRAPPGLTPAPANTRWIIKTPPDWRLSDRPRSAAQTLEKK